MSILIEAQISQMLKDDKLNLRERQHLEELRELNSQYLNAHKNEYPTNPFDHGEEQLRSVVELRVGEVYDIRTRRATYKPFDTSETIKILNIKTQRPFAATPPYTVEFEFADKDRNYGLHSASFMGLEPLPISVLPAKDHRHVGLIWDANVYTRKADTN